MMAKRPHANLISIYLAAVYCALLGHSVARAQTPDDLQFFESQVRPILVSRCESCHGATKQEGGLRLDSRAAWSQGGENGKVIVTGRPEESRLIAAIRYADSELEMPPKMKLPEREIAALTQWVARGAPDPREGAVALGLAEKLVLAKQWWAFQPLQRPAIPVASGPVSQNPIDSFIREKLSAHNLSQAALADKHTLLRRITYDLTGLPPTSAEMQAFIHDRSPLAYERVVDRLLASPHYGERWGRHWLDLVRYADTAGENSDHPLPHAWRYRNWVIDAFNRNQPYDEFLREQIAGDLIAADGPPERAAERIVATGYLAIARRFGHDIDKDIHLTHEDVIDNLGRVTMGLSIACARCHDHKYEAISAADYYALYGIFDSTKMSFPGCEPQQQPRDLISLATPQMREQQLKPWQEKIAAVDRELARVGQESAKVAQQFRDSIAKTSSVLAQGDIDDGQTSNISGERLAQLAVKQGEALQLVLLPRSSHGADTTRIEWVIEEQEGDKRRWSIADDTRQDLLAGNPHADAYGNAAWAFLDGRTSRLLPEPVRDLQGKSGLHVWRNGDTPSVFVNASEASITVWTTLPPRSFFAHPAPDGPIVLAWFSPITGKVTIRGAIAHTHAGQGSDGVAWQLQHISSDLSATVVALREAQSQLPKLQQAKAQLLAQQPPEMFAYAVQEGTPHNVKIHLRGEPERAGAEVPRRWLQLFGGQAITHPSGSGRRDLANWLTARENPLTARVMVNRIWQHHFGKGLVTSSNDFGVRSQPPTHPELLDWLASEFVASGWDIKRLHRWMLLSETYQQSSVVSEASQAKDPANNLYSHFDRRRLSAEELRDSLLAISGGLDRSPGAAHPFPPQNSWSFTQHNPFSDTYASERRSVYLMVKRNRRDPFLALFDGADPNATTPVRSSSIVPTQSLFFLNDPFVHREAERLATSVIGGQAHTRARAEALFEMMFQRPATDAEVARVATFVEQYVQSATEPVTWSALTRILMGSNEFLFID